MNRDMNCLLLFLALQRRKVSFDSYNLQTKLNEIIIKINVKKE